MGLNEQNRKDLIDLYWNKSVQTMEEAEAAVAATKWNMAANRIYYAMFHAVSALLVKGQYPVATHRGAKAALGQHFVLTGKISTDDGRFFAQMETLRDRADYDIVFSATESEIASYMPQAQGFLQRIRVLLDEK